MKILRLELVQKEFTRKDFWILLGITLSLFFIHITFKPIREVPRGDLLIFFATIGIMVHVNIIAGYLYDFFYSSHRS